MSVFLFVVFLLGSLLLQLGVGALGGGGGGLLTLHLFPSFALFLRGRSSVVWLLMPCVLLVRQIPYRALPLGLKVVFCRWSRSPFALLCWCRGSPRLAVGPYRP